MNFLSNSRFNIIFPFDQIDFSEDKFSHIADALSYGEAIVPIYEQNQTRSDLEKLLLLAQKLPNCQLYVLIHSERNLNFFTNFQATPNVKVGVYIPTEQLLHNCIYFGRSYNFGMQIYILRRLFILNVKPFTLCDPDTINDINNYVELVANYSDDLFFIRNSSQNSEIASTFQERVVQ